MECKKLYTRSQRQIISEDIVKLENVILFSESKSQMIVERRRYHG